MCVFSLAKREALDVVLPKPKTKTIDEVFGFDYPVLRQSKVGVGYAVFDLTTPNIIQK
jgi:hypothetical protein